jgi:hypothetical protein
MKTMSRSVQHGLFVAAAIFGLIAVAEGTGNSHGQTANEPRTEQGPASGQANAPETTQSDRIPVTKRANTLGFDENSPDPHRPTCMQLQVVDEIDLIGNADCD